MIVLQHWITNALIFQSVWFAALFFQSQALWFMTAGCVIMLLGHSNRRLNMILALAGSVIGVLVEYTAVESNLMSYQGEAIIPLWLWVLWIALLLTLNKALAKLLTLPMPVQILLFAVCAPPSYLGAANFDVLTIHQPWYVFWPTFGAMWSVGFYIIICINRFLLGTNLARGHAN
ncbi:DUF2878 domain-containing protein [Pseudoalteromonas peptidolytica]|uniref:DUF2878 domain-containing protein n=1 Tax=Pseudoalteromonas peptidolytica F12-50-A1 TaxID=1315280 RepID=A0A8I0T644_9GAMM|nr:DUF2878 domain-containing protein [Pseudoalteromonas peptidolytica]MBE0348720.1 hypothetical protein [Pseudoalteromonas peptidolytica F12-50-A1]NLR15115.1 DUF2878 family protein [Pseudoalteromonas peptidolytica]